VNEVQAEEQVYKNLKIFVKGKSPEDLVFDRLSSSALNAFLHELMDGLTAKVFRTYNASVTLEEQLEKETKSNMNVHELVVAYNAANRAVAILCNHQRSVPKTFDKQLERLEEKVC
jgi:DNA topoisomerase I